MALYPRTKIGKEHSLMGKSKSIQDQQKQNQEFQDYLNEIQKNLTEKADNHRAEFEQRLKDYYGSDYPKVIRIGAGEKYDFRQLNEVTLDNLNSVIKSTVDAIFPGPNQDQKQSEAAKTAIATVTNFREMAASIATNLITAAMNILSISSEVTYNYNLKSESICPGLALHVLVANDAYKDKRWFSNTEIVESYVRYELIFSYNQVKAEMDIEYFNTHLQTISNLETSVNLLYEKYTAMLTDLDIPEEKLNSIERRIDIAREQIEKARADVNAAMQAVNADKLKIRMAEQKITGRRAERISAFLQSAGERVHE